MKRILFNLAYKISSREREREREREGGREGDGHLWFSTHESVHHPPPPPFYYNIKSFSAPQLLINMDMAAQSNEVENLYVKHPFMNFVFNKPQYLTYI